MVKVLKKPELINDELSECEFAIWWINLQIVMNYPQWEFYIIFLKFFSILKIIT